VLHGFLTFLFDRKTAFPYKLIQSSISSQERPQEFFMGD
jgi:hypothetical protein